MHRMLKRPIKHDILSPFIKLVLQKTLISVSFFIFTFELNKSFSITIFTNCAVNKLISPIPNLKDYLFFCMKTRAITIIARISSYSYFWRIIYHKHYLLEFYDVQWKCMSFLNYLTHQCTYHKVNFSY